MNLNVPITGRLAYLWMSVFSSACLVYYHIKSTNAKSTRAMSMFETVYSSLFEISNRNHVKGQYYFASSV